MDKELQSSAAPSKRIKFQPKERHSYIYIYRVSWRHKNNSFGAKETDRGGASSRDKTRISADRLEPHLLSLNLA